MPDAPEVDNSPLIDTSRPHPARVYNYFLSGKDNFAADREAGEKVLRLMPSLRTAARENRGFLVRAVRFLVEEAGVRQFLDIGTGLPAANSVHEVAQAIAPECRVVYVDNDPLVLAHARALLASGPKGRTGYVHADFLDPDSILSDLVTREILDFSRPIALSLMALLHLVPDEKNPRDVIETFLGALPQGSYLAASHATAEHAQESMTSVSQAYNGAVMKGQLRDHDDFARLTFQGLELVPPGVVLVSEWRRDSGGPAPLPSEVNCYGGVARKR